MKRQDFEMTDEDLATLMAACKPVALIATHCGPIKSQQENANDAWAALGKKLGFDHMTVQPISGKGDRFFTADTTVAVVATPELTMPDEQKATEIPMGDCNLSINVGTDGTWMHFKASNGQQCSFNMENMADRDGHITKSALLGWCADRREQAATIRET